MVDAGKKEEKGGGEYKMEIKLLDSDKKTGKVSFLLKDATPSFANALRRNIVDSVPTMAIEDVELSKNSSILYDEIVAHRLGLLVLKTDLKTYNLLSKCKCKGEGCARCSVKMTLSAKGAGYVYASQIKSKDSKIKPVFPKTIIVKLIKGQEIEFTATAILGQGKDHVKWSPGLVWYKYKPIIDIDTAKCTNAQECADVCPVNAFDVKNNKLVINKDNELKCHLCGACAEIAANKSIRIGADEKNYIFYVEPWGQLTAKEMVVKAAEILQEQAEEFEEKLKALK
jgi:DNA-directed RNA polymerase subunit D